MVRIMRRALLFLVALAVLAVAAFFTLELLDRTPSAPPAQRGIPASKLARDIKVVLSALREGHASLDRYQTPVETRELMNSLELLATRRATPVELWKALAASLAQIRDGHLTVLPSSSMYEAFFNSPGHLLPFRVYEAGGRLRILESFSAAAPRAGSEILAMEGVPSRQLVETLGRYVSVDGQVASRRLAVVERDFDLLIALHFGLRTQLTLVVREPDGAERTLPITTMPYAARMIAREVGEPADHDPAKGKTALLPLPTERTVLMRVASFAKDGEVDLPGFFSDSFRRMHRDGVQHLIIDLRNNPGGRDSLGALLYAHLARSRFRWVEARWIKKRSFDFVSGTPERWVNLHLWLMSKHPAPGGGYVFEDELDGWQQPQQPVFTGRVTLLADGTTFSTASEFTSIFKSNRRGFIVGGESGNAYQGDSGATVGLVLPESGLILNVPVVRYDLAVAPLQPGARGVLPDIIVEPSFEDRMAGRDPLLATAVARR